MTKHIFALSIILTAISTSCHDDKKLAINACTPDISIDDVPWLMQLKKTLTNCTCEMSIIKGTYLGQTVFFTGLTDPTCDGIDTPTLYGCEGNEIRSFTTSRPDQEELHDKVTRDGVLYRCKM
jgi:hypothetical protein